MAHLEIDDLTASYGAVPVLKGISLKVEKSEVVSLIGPSGSGKSTLLHSAAGLDRPTSGTVHLGGTREQIAAAHAQINTLEGTVGALKARVATAEEHGGIQREELRMRVEQVRTTAGSNAPTHACLPLLPLPHF